MARKCLDWHALFADTARKDSAQVVVKQAEACANQLGLGEAAAKLFNAVVLLRRSMKVGTGEKHQKEKGKREIQQRAFNALEEILKSRKPVVELIITDFFQTTMKSNVPGDRSSELLEQIRQLYPSKLPREPFLFERYDTIVKESPAGSEEQIRQLQLACEGEMEGYVYMHTVPSIKEYMIEVGNTWVYDAFWQEIKVDPSMVLFKLQNALGNHRHLGTYDLVPQIADKQAMLRSSLHKYMNLWHDSLKPLADQQGLYGIKDNLKAIRDVEADCKQGFPKICDLFESLLPGCIRELFDVLQRYGKRLDDKLQGRVDDIMNAFQSYKAANGLQKQAVKNVIMWDGSGTFRRALQFDFAAKAPELQMSDDEFLSAVNDLKISHEDIEVDFTDTSKAMRIISEGCLQEKPWELDAASVNGWRHKKEFTPPVVSAAASAYAVTQAQVFTRLHVMVLTLRVNSSPYFRCSVFHLALLAQCAHGDVITLADENMSMALQDSSPLFVKFYAPWCGHCKKMSKAWEDFGKQDLGDVRIGQVDCTQSPNIASQFGIKGFPTLLLIRNNGDNVYEYTDDRSVLPLISFALTGWRNAQQYDPSAPQPPSTRSWLYIGMGVLMLMSLVVALCVAVFDDTPRKKRQSKKH